MSNLEDKYISFKHSDYKSIFWFSAIVLAALLTILCALVYGIDVNRDWDKLNNW